MEFKIDTYSDDGEGIFGNKSKIKELKGTTIKIRTLNDLKKLTEEINTDIAIDFRLMRITIHDYYCD